ncbi:MAG: hypothetical protein J2P17_33420 [Mycobacterium sp.]|nr:hypothetical protein [Mycobacterium sp.]
MAASLLGRVTAVLADPHVTPNQTGLPGMSLARKITGAVLTFGLIASVAGLAISALVWALSAHNGNSHYASRGRMGVVIAAAAALLIGGADAIVTFFQNAGGQI